MWSSYFLSFLATVCRKELESLSRGEVRKSDSANIITSKFSLTEEKNSDTIEGN